MADSTSIRCVTFGDMVSIVSNRGQIAGDVQDRDLNFIKGSINEHYITIATERDWSWRKFDRDYLFKLPTTTGTVAVTNLSRAVVFTGLTIDNTYVGKSFKVTGDNVLYRIVGFDIGTNTLYLSSNFAGVTNATATYKIYHYEFPAPPDCDEIVQMYYDFPLTGYAGGVRQIDPQDVLSFNRALAGNVDYAGPPVIFNRDGKISAETLPPLDEMILDYDFLGGDPFDTVDKIRLFPIEPDANRVIHINYSMHVEDMANDSDEPLIPIDDRWVLVHFALADWFRVRGQVQSADRELSIATNRLKKMQAEFKKTDPKPKLKSSLARYSRVHFYNKSDDLFYISRQAES